MMLWFMACFDCLRDTVEARIQFVGAIRCVCGGTERVLNFCSGDEDSALDPTNVISFTPCGIAEAGMIRNGEYPQDSLRRKCLTEECCEC